MRGAGYWALDLDERSRQSNRFVSFDLGVLEYWSIGAMAKV
jgi:hypothetical protein